MQTTAIEVQKILEGSPENGVYEGKWSGYVVTFVAGLSLYKAKTKEGIRGISDCSVIISNDAVTVKI